MVLLAEGEAHQVLPIVAVVREHVDRNGRDADPLGQCAAEISRIGFAQRSDVGKEEYVPPPECTVKPGLGQSFIEYVAFALQALSKFDDPRLFVGERVGNGRLERCTANK